MAVAQHHFDKLPLFAACTTHCDHGLTCECLHRREAPRDASTASPAPPPAAARVRVSSDTDQDVLLIAGGGGSSATGVGNHIASLSVLRPCADSISDAIAREMQAGLMLEAGEKLSTDASTAYSIACAPNGRMLAAACGGSVKLYTRYGGSSAAVGVHVASHAVLPLAGSAQGSTATVELHSVAWAPNGCVLAVGSEAGYISLLHVAQPQVLPPPTTSPPASGVRSVILPVQPLLLCTFRAHEGTVESLAFSPTGRFLLSTSSIGPAAVWSTAWLPAIPLTRFAATQMSVPTHARGQHLPSIGALHVGDAHAPILKRGEQGRKAGTRYAGAWRFRHIASVVPDGSRIVAVETTRVGATVLSFWRCEQGQTPAAGVNAGHASAAVEVSITVNAALKGGSAVTTSDMRWVCTGWTLASTSPVSTARYSPECGYMIIASVAKEPFIATLLKVDTSASTATCAWSRPLSTSQPCTAAAFLPRSRAVALCAPTGNVYLLPLDETRSETALRRAPLVLLSLSLLLVLALFATWLLTEPPDALQRLHPVLQATATWVRAITPPALQSVAEFVRPLAQF